MKQLLISVLLVVAPLGAAQAAGGIKTAVDAVRTGRVRIQLNCDAIDDCNDRQACKLNQCLKTSSQFKSCVQYLFDSCHDEMMDEMDEAGTGEDIVGSSGDSDPRFQVRTDLLQPSQTCREAAQEENRICRRDAALDYLVCVSDAINESTAASQEAHITACGHLLTTAQDACSFALQTDIVGCPFEPITRRVTR